MSYILEALKKADKGRRSGRVPSLTEVPPETVSTPFPRFHGKTYIGVVVLLVSIGLALGGWWSAMKPLGLPVREANTKIARVNNNQVIGSAAPNTGKATSKTATAATASDKAHTKSKSDLEMKTSKKSFLPATHGKTASEQTSVNQKMLRKTTTISNKTAVNKTTSLPKAKPRTNNAERNKKMVAAKTIVEQLTAAASPQPVKKKVPDWRDLPLSVRQELPAMRFSMLIYAKRPEDRMLSINGHIRHEGDEISGGLILEEITPDGGIFRYKHYRFRKGVF